MRDAWLFSFKSFVYVINSIKPNYFHATCLVAGTPRGLVQVEILTARKAWIFFIYLYGTVNDHPAHSSAHAGFLSEPQRKEHREWLHTS